MYRCMMLPQGQRQREQNMFVLPLREYRSDSGVSGGGGGVASSHMA